MVGKQRSKDGPFAFQIRQRFIACRSSTNALVAVNGADMHDALQRHLAGDWEDVSEEQWKENDQAVIDRSRTHSTYRDREGVKFTLVTEISCSMTTILLPEEF